MITKGDVESWLPKGYIKNRDTWNKQEKRESSLHLQRHTSGNASRKRPFSLMVAVNTDGVGTSYHPYLLIWTPF